MPAYRSPSFARDPSRPTRRVRFHPGLHFTVLAPIFAASLWIALSLAQRGSEHVSIHVHRTEAPPEERPFVVILDAYPYAPPARALAFYEVKRQRLLGGSRSSGAYHDLSRPFVVDDCRIGLAEKSGRLAESLTHDRCAALSLPPQARLEQARAVEQLEAFRRDDAARAVDVAYGSRWSGVGAALLTLAIGALLAIAALLRRASVTVDHPAGVLRVEERRFPFGRRRIEIPLADVAGACVETTGRGLLRYRVTILCRGNRVPLTDRYAPGEKRHIDLRHRIEAALAGDSEPLKAPSSAAPATP